MDFIVPTTRSTQEPPQEIQITIIDSNGEKRTRKSVLDENFKVKNLVGGDSSKHKETS